MAAPDGPIQDFPQPSLRHEHAGYTGIDAYGPGHIENFKIPTTWRCCGSIFRWTMTARLNSILCSAPSSTRIGRAATPIRSWFSWMGPTPRTRSPSMPTANRFKWEFRLPVWCPSPIKSAFADPHGVLGLTTTTALLNGDNHTLLFEIGDVNDHILDSAVFISNLRSCSWNGGTELTDPEDPLVPEPGAMTLWVIALSALEVFRRARRHAK